MHSTEKIVFAGNSIYYYHYSRHIEYGEEKPKRRGFAEIVIDSADEDNDLPKQFNPVDLHAYRVRKSVKLIVECNASQYPNGDGGCYAPIFGTFTYRDNIRDVATANPMFKDFTARLNYRIYGKVRMKLKYLVVPEFQPVSGRVHYHAIYFNLPYVPMVYDFFKEVWGNGFVNIKTVYGTQHLTNYVAKYITKDKRDERLAGKKKYFCSRGLLRPVTFREGQVILPFLNKLNLAPDFSGSFTAPLSDLTTDCMVFRTEASKLDEFRQAMQDHFSCNQFTKRIERAPKLDTGKIWIPAPRTVQDIFTPAPAKQVQQNLFLPKP
jgi:hypothetical protein